MNSKTILRASGGIYYSDQSPGGTYTAGFTASPSFTGANAFHFGLQLDHRKFPAELQPSAAAHPGVPE